MASFAGSKGGINTEFKQLLEFRRKLFQKFSETPYAPGDVALEARVEGLGSIVTSCGGLRGLRDLYAAGAEPLSARDAAYAMVHSPVYSPTGLLSKFSFNECALWYEDKEDNKHKLVLVRNPLPHVSLDADEPFLITDDALQEMKETARVETSERTPEERTISIINSWKWISSPSRGCYLHQMTSEEVTRWLFRDQTQVLVKKNYQEIADFQITNIPFVAIKPKYSVDQTLRGMFIVYDQDECWLKIGTDDTSRFKQGLIREDTSK